MAICDAIIDNVGIFNSALSLDKMQSDKALLWLNFEEEFKEGNFFSYGIGARTYGSVWPDRTPQPEMWQMKKTCQPFDFSMVDETNYIIQIWNHLSFTPSQYYDITWSLKEDDTVIQSGIIDCPIEPLQKKQVKLPIVMPTIKAGAEYRIELTACIKGNELWAKKGHLVAWEQLELSWHKIEMLVAEPCKGKLIVDNTDSITVVSGNNFSYTFSRKEGKLISMVVNGKEMLIEAPLMNVWRAPLANELDDWTVWSENRNGWKRSMVCVR